MNPAPKRRQHTDAPVTKLVPHAFDHDIAIVGNNNGSKLLIGQIAQHVLRRTRVQIMFGRQPRHGDTARRIAQLPH
jgi:hypothetical protein